MRKLERNEIIQRGCEYCADHRQGGRKGIICTYTQCPYHELDNVKTYREYEKSLTGEDVIKRYVKKLCEVSEK